MAFSTYYLVFEQFILIPFAETYHVKHPQFNFLFNSYYNSLGERTARNQRGLMTRPAVSEVFEYREYVDQAMLELIAQGNEEVLSLVALGLNHEQQHQELLVTDLKFSLWFNPLDISLMDIGEYVIPNSSPWVEKEEGIYEVGYKGNGFCFDNELNAHKVYLNAFRISGNLVSNEEYLEFIHVGGYENPIYWHDEGWAWVQQQKIKKPLYWEYSKDTWNYYTLNGKQSIELKAPVAHVSFYEAAAFANWKGKRLPTEFEWEVAQQDFHWGSRWEWTNSAYLPYPGFKIAPGALGEYNGKFMVNQMVLRGASIATPENHSRPSYRNFFIRISVGNLWGSD
ncbi:ergothioneine biosynthesis protein EgtB [Algoriphagus halophilus]|uniref:ergothioneine biosynthesis protein EgtB n=1 Tax=Algoriphagus halophilus TaxID=226505 RepID=UPI00358F3D5D